MPPRFGHDENTVASASHVGRVRETNEDSVAVLESLSAAILADGIGGHGGGGTASRVAVDSIAASLASGTGLVDAIALANQHVIRVGRRDGNPNMGTTVVAVQMQGRKFQVAWVGDSRAYRLGAEPELLTRDHSVVGDLQSAGDISAEQARTHPMRHVLTRALGSAPLAPAEVATATGQLASGEYLLLCSDGLHGVIADDEIHRIVSSAGDVPSAADALVEAALDRGGPDNISVVLAGPALPENKA
ncbi:MAG: serine/threonine-protein phosphatase [Xanthomonadales bacterium]|nr:serine/threonine-protein phosphatase [Xanthomonadales bacterium]